VRLRAQHSSLHARGLRAGRRDLHRTRGAGPHGRVAPHRHLGRRRRHRDAGRAPPRPVVHRGGPHRPAAHLQAGHGGAPPAQPASLPARGSAAGV
ncbi:MAG: hypothetical protein AVDCRST_MAG68-1837, partial [uncultured Gemmatimonadetes bacterium]